MQYVVIEAYNANDMWEADVFGSDDGVVPVTSKYHLMMGDVPGEDVAVSVRTILERVGWAIADQRRIDEEFIWQQGEGARRLITSAKDTTEVVVNIRSVGIPMNDAIGALKRGSGQS